MRKLKFLAGSLLLLITFTGCLRVDTTINLNPDGSGTIVETVFMKSAVLDMIRQFTSAFDENEETEEFNFYNEEEQRKKATDYGEEVEFNSGEELYEPEWEGYRVVYSFRDINKLKIDPSPDDKVNIGDEVETEENVDREYLTFNFKKGNPSDLNINFPKPDFENEETTEVIESVEADSSNTEMTEMFKNMFEGMTIAVNLRLNGKIEETNATFVNDNVITMMEIDFTNILLNEDLVKALEVQKPQSLEEFRNLTKDIEGIKIEFNDKVNVKFN
jgi:hypothetical protein